MPAYLHAHTHTTWLLSLLPAYTTLDFVMNFYKVLLAHFEVNMCAKREERFLTLNLLGHCAVTHRSMEFKGLKEAISVAGAITVNAGASLPVKSVLRLCWICRQPRHWKQNLNQLKLCLAPAMAGYAFATLSHETVWNCVTRINILTDM